jgi:hypothetical protein
MGSIKGILAALILACLSAPAPVRADEPPPTITGIRAVKSGDLIGIEISGDRQLEYACNKMAQLYRVVIDFPRTMPGRPDTLYRVGAGMISTVKVEQKTINDVPLTRMVVDLTGDADFTALVDPEDKRRVTVYFRPAPPAAAAGQEKPAAAEPAAAKEPPASAPAQAATAPTAPQTAPAQTAPQAETAPPLPKAEPAPAPAPSGTARVATIDRISCGAEGIDIHTDRAVGPFRSFTLREPARLVIDIPAARSTAGPVSAPDNPFGVTAVRVGNFEGKLRLVFVTGKKPFPRYRVESSDAGLRIVPGQP